MPRPRLATFAALRYPNYRLWFIGQLASLVGTWMQSTAQGYLVYQLTRSPEYLGYIGFANGLPTWLFMLWAGVISDRMPRRNLLIITQTIMMVLAFILAGLTWSGVVQAWHILVLSFLLGVANAFEAPTRLAFTLEMVEREDLSNAVALNAAMFNSAAAVGPSVAGLVYAALGPVWCFAINGLSFLAVIAALAMMHLKPFQPPARLVSPLEALKEGLGFVRRHQIVRTLTLVAGGTALLGLGFITLFPAWAVEILKGDSTTFGYLMSARGAGALGGALLLATLGRFRFKGWLLTAGSFLLPLLMIAFSQTRALAPSLLMLYGTGLSAILTLNVANALVQSLSPDELRGRVMSVYAMVFFGLMPLGSLATGALAQRAGLVISILLGAFLLLGMAGAVFLAVPKIRVLES